ncbi:sigma-54 dependent transcriptional regulator [Rickettsiales bacterium]|nr:sigma-54 dependent transcriptional regulator [Rickettsiales bacterium]
MALDILVVDDEEDIRDMVSDILMDSGYSPRVASNSTSTMNAINERVPSAIILDIWLQGSELDGLGILEAVKKKHSDLPVIMISGHGSIETAVNAIKLGAYDYIEKPFKEDKLLLLIRRAIEASRLKAENDKFKIYGHQEPGLIGTSQAIVKLRSLIDRVSTTESRVLLTGPLGCGKESFAQLIHKQSRRSKNPFVTVNVASADPDSLEEELFGVEDNGKILGAPVKIGALERAHGGTLFIEEVADLSPEIQSKLTQFLQRNSFCRKGGNKPVKVDVRIITSSSKNLLKLVEKKLFREDLYYRLNVASLSIPPIKDRKKDINLLVQYFIRNCSGRLGVAPRQLDSSAMAAMEMYDWPGNIRQIRNVIEKLLIMPIDGDSDVISSSMLPAEIVSPDDVPQEVSDNFSDIISLSLRDARRVFEVRYLKAQLNRFGGNISQTASFIGMERSAFHRKIKQLEICSDE